MTFAGATMLIGLLILVCAYLYDHRFGRSEEYGPLVIMIVGAILLLVGLLTAIARWIATLL